MTTQLDIARDPNSLSTFITEFSDSRASILLSANTNATIPVPADARFAVINYDTGKDVFVSQAAITIPPDSVPSALAGVLLKPSVNVSAASITELHFKCIEVAFVSVEFYT